MASITKIRGKYDKLDDQERLRLVASAINRGDGNELKTLKASTVRKTYTMPDAWMVDRYTALWDVSVIYWLITEELLHKREAARHAYSNVRVDIEDSQELGDALNDIDDAVILKIIATEIAEFTRHIFAASQAVKKLSLEIDLKPGELIAYTPEHVKNRLEVPLSKSGESIDGEFIDDAIDWYYTVFASYWPKGNTSQECG